MLEAFIAIILIIGILLLVYSQNAKKENKADNILDIESYLLERVASNEIMRDAVLSGDVEEVKGYIDGINEEEKIIPHGYNHDVLICEIDGECSFNQEGEIYSKERVISSSLSANNHNPKIVKISIWRSYR